MDFIEDGYPSLNPSESEMIKEATERHSKFYTAIHGLNDRLERNGEPVQTVRVMTQNMHARPEPFELPRVSSTLAPPCDPAYNFENRQTDRVINVVKSIKSLPKEIIPHVICFQELQGSKDKVMFDNLTRRDPTDTVVYKRVNRCMEWNGIKNNVKTSFFGYPKEGPCLPSAAYGFLPGGLTTYSTLDIVFQTYHTFVVGTGGENVVSKGVLYSKIQISKPDKPEKYIHVLNCHPLAPITFARGECEGGITGYFTNVANPRNCTTYELRTYQNDQLKEIYKFKQSLQAGGQIRADELVVYAGDMNINQYMALWETEQQKKIETATACCGEEFYSLLTKLKAEHPPVYLNPKHSIEGGKGGIGGHNGIFTWDGGENAITQSLLWPKSFTWIDYVLYSIENAKPLYADNFIVRFKQAEKLYERGQVYQKACFDYRTKKINELQDKPVVSILDSFVLDDDLFLTNPEQKELNRLKEFQELAYGTDFIDAVAKDPKLFYLTQAKKLEISKDAFKSDDNPNNNKPPVKGFQSITAFEDVSDHYGVIATFIIPTSQDSLIAFNKLMQQRFNEGIRHELFFYLPLQPIVIGKNDDGKMLRLASRMDPRSPKMDTDLWNRQTGVKRLMQYSTDKRISRAAYISSLNATAALNEKVYTVKKPRLISNYAYSDCQDDDVEECQRKRPGAFQDLTHVRPILKMSDLKAMGIEDVDARYHNRYREEPVMVQLPTPRVMRQRQAFMDNVQYPESMTPQTAPQTSRRRQRFTPRNTPRQGRGTPFKNIGTPRQGRGTPRQGLGTPRQGLGMPLGGTPFQSLGGSPFQSGRSPRTPTPRRR